MSEDKETIPLIFCSARAVASYRSIAFPASVKPLIELHMLALEGSLELGGAGSTPRFELRLGQYLDGSIIRFQLRL
jgi:hypothetical protein